jgi:hypothetical protein
MNVTFDIGLIDNLEIYVKWYHYASKKYIHVTTWICFDKELGEMEDK